MPGATTPEIAVVVPSHNRPLRLRWLLNALEEQDLEPHRYEVIVCHDSTGPETEELLRTHPLAKAGVLRHITVDPGPWAAAKRNMGWRAARAPVIAFTDDDCRPPSDWVRKALAAAHRHPNCVVQGATQPDPEETEIAAAPYFHTQTIWPPRPWAETCNIVYPRELLERLGGFVEDLYTGEDTDLAFRAGKLGSPLVGAPEVVMSHAVVEISLRDTLRSARRWEDLPSMIKLHPELRDQYVLWAFWKRTHVWLPLALGGLLFGRGKRWTVLLAIPWAVQSSPGHGSDPRGRFRQVTTWPARLLIDTTEFLALVKGSIKHRSFFL